MKNSNKLSRAEMREVVGGRACSNPCTATCKINAECTAAPDGVCSLTTCTDHNCPQIKMCFYP